VCETFFDLWARNEGQEDCDGVTCATYGSFLRLILERTFRSGLNLLQHWPVHAAAVHE
jgi:hypothetical protein